MNPPPSAKMKAPTRSFFAAALLGLAILSVATSQEPAKLILLTEEGARNLRIQTEPAQPRTFESAIFAIGRIEEIPANHSVLSSRIAGRVIAIHAYEGDLVSKGQLLAEVESRQPGNPPPIIELRAPQDGLIAASHIRLGQPVEPENELLDISDRSSVWAVARIPEKDAAAIAPGAKARIHIPALGGQALEATLARFGVSADRASGTVEGIFKLPNPELRLRPGLRAEFSIITQIRENVMTIPRSAIQGDPANRFVFVADFDLPHAYLRVPVALGEENDLYAEVLSGLFPADDVVTQGSYSLGFADPSKSGISLKEALDAAHGHEHNEDGSELTPAQKRQLEAEKAAAAGKPNARSGPLVFGLSLLSGVLFALLIVSQLRQNRHSAS